MKVGFIENRQKTWLWQSIAERLAHNTEAQIQWLVQNPAFAPRGRHVGTQTVMPFPRAADLVHDLTPDLQRVASTDRGIHVYGMQPSHYAHYWKQIASWLDTHRPDVVFGESTLFHEIMAIQLCRSRQIPFLQPTSSRYPPGRFSVYFFDTLLPFGGSGEDIDDAAADSMIVSIARRRVVPSYVSALRGRRRWLAWRLRLRMGQLRVLGGYVQGERFNTPSPWRKLRLERSRARLIAEWQRIAAARFTAAHRPRVLYAMQLQPESSIDVFAPQYQDQAGLILQLAEALPSHWELAVKLTPYPQQEMSQRLIYAAASHPRIRPLSAETNMDEALAENDAVVTVTGTVSIESSFGSIPALTLAWSLNNLNPQCVVLESPAALTTSLRRIEARQFPLATGDEKRRHLKALVRTSYSGVISDPVSAPGCLVGENTTAITEAFKDVLGTLERQGLMAGIDSEALRSCPYDVTELPKRNARVAR